MTGYKEEFCKAGIVAPSFRHISALNGRDFLQDVDADKNFGARLIFPTFSKS